MKFRIRDYLINPISIGGLILSVICFGASTVLLILDMFNENANPYRGILTFFIFPGLMFFGLAIVVFGMVLEARRLNRMKTLAPEAVRRVMRKGRTFGYGLLGGGLLLLLLSALGGYRAYEFTDSVHFCGALCHEVMQPEFVTYQGSPHARVKCVECHVGPGAQWYVKAKLSGLYQIYATVADKYPRPIPTPIENLRPAQATCEQCHWPEKFFGAQLATRVHYGFDYFNTRREILMLVKTGGGGSAHGPSEGIHWHMNIKNHVQYISRDDKRLVIPWVQVTRPDGTIIEYHDSENPPTEEEMRTLPRRRMDCVDCHNRPTHIFLNPAEMVDRLMANNRIDAAIPYLKKEAVAVVSRDYATLDEAFKGIEEGLLDRYRKDHPEAAKKHEKGIQTAIERLKEIYPKNFFPSMKSNWSVYPTHIGHREFPGCFRCHSGHHVNKEGQPLSKSCDICHSFVIRHEDRVSLLQVPSDASFIHPWHGGHEDLKCWDCHTGKESPYRKCAECHEREQDAPMQFACAVCHKPMVGPKVTAASACLTCHDLDDSDFHLVKEHQKCTDCHAPHGWDVDLPGNCQSCHAEFLKTHLKENQGKKCSECHEFGDVSSGMVKAR